MEQAKLFKITCSDWNGATRGKPYCEIAIAANTSLAVLAETAIGSFDFDLDHSYGFYDNLKNWTRSYEGYELFADMGHKEKFPGVKQTKVDKVFHTAKQKMLLLFDYGDEWRFIVEFMGNTNIEAGLKLPLVLKSKGEAPNQYGDFEDEEDDE